MNTCTQPGCENTFEPVIRGGRNVRMWCSEHATNIKVDGKRRSNPRFKYNSNCSECGRLFKHCESRYLTHRCPVCRVEVPAQKKAEREAAAAALRIAKKHESARAKLAKAAAGSSGRRIFISGPCEICGDVFFGYGSHFDGLPFTCSDACKNRRAKSKSRRRDADYPHWAVVARSHESMDCWICSEVTDPRDFVSDEHFIAGPNYPSVDHIVPVSEGGSGEMDNLKIAHMLCNALRGITPAELVTA